MPGIHGATRVPPLASLKRLSSFCHSTPGIITTSRLQQRTYTSRSEHLRGLRIIGGQQSAKAGLLKSASSAPRSYSISLSPPSSRRMSSTTAAADGSQSQASNGNSNGENATKKVIYFGPFEVTNQVFLKTAYSFALVNLKPLLPGHVLVCPLRPAKRLTDLSAAEVTDLFSAVQTVQRMLARYYFTSSSSTTTTPTGTWDGVANPAEIKTEPNAKNSDLDLKDDELCTLGSFNIAVQDGPEAGQTVAHVHVHVIPRIRGSTAKDVETPSDELYDRMAAEDGNVGGAQWDHYHQRQQQQQQQRHRDRLKHQEQEQDDDYLGKRPEPGGQFPGIEDSQRMARGMEEMEAEAEVFRRVLRDMEVEGDGL
ncbi:HIT-like domain containing protein [Naviculisporaceae sp. PSN 640]